METTKFINNDMACMAATAAFMAAAHTGHYTDLAGGDEVGKFTLDVYLELDELFTLPTGYVFSGVEEINFENPHQYCPPFKIKKYYFNF